MQTIQRPYLSMSEVAAELSVSVATIRRAIERGDLPATKAGLWAQFDGPHPAPRARGVAVVATEHRSERLMPRAAKAKTPDPDQVYFCWMSGSAEVDGQNYNFTRGERFLGSNPVVQNVAWVFIPDGAATDETPSHWDTLVARAEAEQATVEHDAICVHTPVALEREDVRVLNRAVAVLVGAGKDKELVRYERGNIFRADSELVGVLPDAFEDPPEGVEIVRPKASK
jgi:Helix-turn-helix domain